MRLGTAFVEVRPDTRGFKAELAKETTQSASDVSRQLGAALAGGAFLAGAKRATDAASQLEQAVGGTAAVFGEARKEVEDFAKGAAESAGLSERAARELTSQLGGLLKGFGFTNTEAADLSVTLAKLGADLAATFGGTPEEAVQALGAALRGETDPLERFGIALNQTLVNQRAVELGLAASTSAVDQHAKAQASLSLIMERSADAQGQFAREADTAAGQAAIAAAKAENSAADLGENLLPIYTKLAETVGVVADGFSALPEPVQTAVIAIAGIAALSGPVKASAEATGSLATIVRTQLTKGLDVAATGAYSLAGNLGKAIGTMGALGVAVAGAAVIFDSYAKDKAKAADIEAEYTRILEEQAGAFGEVGAAAVGQRILEGDLGEALRNAEVNLEALTAGVEGSTEAVTKLNDEFWNPIQNSANGMTYALEAAGLAGSALGDELLRLEASGQLSDDQLRELTNRLNDQAEGLITSRQNHENNAAATEASGAAAETAAPKVAELTEKLDVNEQAAKDAAESVDLFREAVEKALQPLDREAAVDQRSQALSDIAADIDQRRQDVEDARRRIADLQAIKPEDRPDDFARQMEAAQADLRDALDATTLTLDGNTDAARRNREQVRGVVEDSVGIIEAAREEGVALDDLRLIRINEINTLRDQLTQMGFNEEEIERYIDVIKDIPLTRATTLTVDTAKAHNRIKDLAESLQALAPEQKLSIDAAVIDRNLQRAAANANREGYAAGGFPFDGDFLVHADEVLRKRGSDLEVIAGPTPTRIDGDGLSASLLATMQEQNALLAQIAGNTAGPTTGTRLRRVQMATGVL